MTGTDILIVGAGPYALSLAAHLAHRGIEHRIVGRPMAFWSGIADAGGERYLKSFCFGTSISTPLKGFTFADYNTPRKLETFEPCSIRNFADYGLWFQKQNVPWVQTGDVSGIRRCGPGFEVEIAQGAAIRASRVVMATGLSGFSRIPEELSTIARDVVAHTSSITRFSEFAGMDVAVIGAGQSALEAAALLREAGARPQLIVRKAAVEWMTRTPRDRNLMQRVRSPLSDLGTGPKAWLLTNFPGAMHLVPTEARKQFVRRHLPPEGAWWLRSRVEHKVPVHNNTIVTGAQHYQGRISLALYDKARRSRCCVVVDRVITGTGFEIDVDRLQFLDVELRRAITRIEQAPALDRHFESSVPGLYFVGPASAMSFGPLFRFVAGVGYASKVVSDHLALAVTRRC
jgi:lysine/ornithine N-monooxygenase